MKFGDKEHCKWMRDNRPPATGPRPQHLSHDQEAAYIENPDRCPFCGEIVNLSRHPLQIDEGNEQNPYQERKCHTCGQVWTDVYKLVRVFTDYDRTDR